jgi:hypothetical protein
MSLDQAVQPARARAEAMRQIIVDRSMPMTDRGHVQDAERRVVLDEIPVLIARTLQPGKPGGASGDPKYRRALKTRRRGVRQRAVKRYLGALIELDRGGVQRAMPEDVGKHRGRRISERRLDPVHVRAQLTADVLDLGVGLLRAHA